MEVRGADHYRPALLAGFEQVLTQALPTVQVGDGVPVFGESGTPWLVSFAPMEITR